MSTKGFTLIEIIVVLVIIGILAAAVAPTMLGFVSQARGQEHVTVARMGMVAAQAVATEHMARTGGRVDADKITESPRFGELLDAGVSANAFVFEYGSANSTEAGYSTITKVVYTAATHEVTICRTNGTSIVRRSAST